MDEYDVDAFIWVSVVDGKWSKNQVQNRKFLEELLVAMTVV